MVIISRKSAILNPNFRFKNSRKIILNFRQNEFTVMSGRKKAVRRIFLFENLILFTKPKRTTQGGDVYQYKNSWLVSFKKNFQEKKIQKKIQKKFKKKFKKISKIFKF